MSKRSKYITIGIFAVILIIVGAFFIYSFFYPGDREETFYTPEGEISQTIENPEVVDSGSDTTVTDNSDLSDTLDPTAQMQQVIDQNKGNINNTEVIDQLSPSYPSNLIPIYKANSAADSSDIITDNGNPGWIAQYGSDALVPDIVGFYQDLLKSTSGYNTQTDGDATTIVGTVDNCYVQIVVSPNNPDRTGLNDQSSVDIFIERT